MNIHDDSSTSPINGSISLLIVFASQLALVICLFSPLISLILAISLLGFCGELISNNLRKYLCIIISISFSAIVSSRAYGISISDDFANSYYDNYIGLCNGNYDNLFTYSNGLEIGLPLLFLIISIFIKNLTPTGLIYLVSLLSALLYFGWLEIYGLKNIPANRKGITVAFSALLLGLLFSAQITRQFIATILILYALFSNNYKNAILFVFIGSVFHLAALPTYLMAHLLWRSKIYSFILMLLLVLPLGSIFIYFVGISTIDLPVLSKLTFWSGDLETSSIDISMLKLMSVVGAISLLSILIKKYRSLPNCISCIYLFWGSFFIALILLPFPMMPLRVTLIVNSLMLGWLLAVFLNPIAIRYVKAFLLLVLIFKIRTLTIVSMEDDMRLWEQFPWWNILPGYFFM